MSPHVSSRRTTKSPMTSRTLELTPVASTSFIDSGGNALAPWLDNILDREYASVEARLHDEILAYVDYMSPTPEEQTVVKHVVDRVRPVFHQPFHTCKVHVFGSTATGLRLPGSDIDLVIETTDWRSSKAILLRLSGIVKSQVWCTEQVEVNHRHGFPSSLFLLRHNLTEYLNTNSSGSLKFDMGINNMNGLRTGEFVKESLNIMPALRPLVLVVKRMLSQRGLNDASMSGMSSFAVICMCIFFLKVNPHGLAEEYLADPLRTKSLGFILHGFLRYYSQRLPFGGMYLSVSEGRLIPRARASWIGEECSGGLVIQYLCDPERNITKALTPTNLYKIRNIFAHAEDAMGRCTATSRDILGTLVYVDAEFVEHREHIRHLVESGNLTESRTQSGSEPAVRGDAGVKSAGPPMKPLTQTGLPHPLPNRTGVSISGDMASTGQPEKNHKSKKRRWGRNRQ